MKKFKEAYTSAASLDIPKNKLNGNLYAVKVNGNVADLLGKMLSDNSTNSTYDLRFLIGKQNYDKGKEINYGIVVASHGNCTNVYTTVEGNDLKKFAGNCKNEDNNVKPYIKKLFPFYSNF